MRKVLTVFVVMMALFAAVDLAYFETDSEEYIFGTEIGGWKYLSRENFIITNLSVIGFALLTLAINVVISRRGRPPD